MTKGLQPQDRQRTTALLQSVANGVALDQTLPNWLRHRGGNAKIDFELLSGTTMARMSVHRGAVSQHLGHLNAVHGLTVVKAGDTYHLAVRPL